MGNDQAVQDIEISPKITNAIDTFNQKLSRIESAKGRRALLLQCKVPETFDKEFDLNQWIHIARYVLQHDSITADIRQKCVPSLIKESEFWKRYFYLVKEEKKRQRLAQKDESTSKAAPVPQQNSQPAATEQEPVQTDKKKHQKKRKDKSKHKGKKQMTEHVQTSSTEQKQADEDEDEEAFQVLLHKPIIWLYKIPATIWRGRNNKCELWSLRNPIWMGRVRIVAFKHGAHLQFQFLEKDGKLFLKSTLIKLDEISDDDSNPIHQYFDAYGVIDSSRYFIIWVDVPSKSRVPFGFGIRERQDAFDIRACVADQMKIVRRRNHIDDADDDDEQEVDAASNGHKAQYHNLNDAETDEADQVSEYEWLTDDEYDGAEQKEKKDEVERKCVELDGDGKEETKKEKKKKWMKRVKVNKKRNKKRKNRFELGADEMISIGHDIDNVEHQMDAHAAKHKHSTILKVKMNDAEQASQEELYLLPPPPSPPLTPTNELSHIENIDRHIGANADNYKAEYDDDDFGEFQLPNDDNDNDNGNEPGEVNNAQSM